MLTVLIKGRSGCWL